MFGAVTVFLVAPAVWLVIVAVQEGSTWRDWLLLGSLAAILLLLPARIVWVQVRRRWKTGAWSLRPTPEERIALHAKWGVPKTGMLWRIARSSWFTSGISVLSCALVLGTLLRPHHPPLSRTDVTVVVVLVLSVVLNLWILLRGSKRNEPFHGVAS